MINRYETSELQVTIVLHEPCSSDKLSGEDSYYTIKAKGHKEVNADVLGIISNIIELIAKMGE